MIDSLRGKITTKDWTAVGLILAVAVMAGAVFYFFVYGAQQKRLEAAEQSLEVVKADLANAKEIERNIAALEEETQKTQLLFDEFERRLPSEREIPTLLQEFESLADEVGLQVNLEPDRPVQEGQKEIIPYKITAFGTFHQVASFVNRLERFRRYLKISDLHIGPQKDGVSEARFTLSTFRFIEPASTKTPTATSGDLS